MRTVLITGAGRGLGRAMALHLAAPGTRLLLHHHRSGSGAAETVAEARGQGAEVHALSADLADMAQREALLEDVARHTDALHLLIHNAGVYPEAHLLEISPAQWQTVLDATCSAVFHLTQGALPLLRRAALEHGPARVIALGDSGADRIVARTTATPYHIAKLGVHVLVRSFAKALGPDKIAVNQISPGFLENSVGEPGSPFPAGRPGTFGDVLGALDYLLSPAADYVSGANLVVSGGWNA